MCGDEKKRMCKDWSVEKIMGTLCAFNCIRILQACSVSSTKAALHTFTLLLKFFYLLSILSSFFLNFFLSIPPSRSPLCLLSHLSSFLLPRLTAHSSYCISSFFPSPLSLSVPLSDPIQPASYFNLPPTKYLPLMDPSKGFFLKATPLCSKYSHALSRSSQRKPVCPNPRSIPSPSSLPLWYL